MQRIAVFPGSFDPVTRGHVSIIRRALPLFDRIIVAIGENDGKQAFFPLEVRLGWLKVVFGDELRITISHYSGLTVDFCRSQNAGFILRGLRGPGDLEFERTIGHMNRMMEPGIETVFLLCDPEYAPVSSSIVREIVRNGGDAGVFVPEGIRLVYK